MTHWSDTLAVFDTETTGLDTRHARIVTCFLGIIGPNGEVQESHSWLADPGVDIPEQAAAVHGVTTEMAREQGRSAPDVVREIGDTVGGYLASGLPVVAYNAVYDFSILHHEMVRYDIAPLSDPRPIIDPLVIDRAVDTYRKGKRTLGMAAAHYLVALDDSHRADADAIAAGRVAQAILRQHEETLTGDAQWLHDQQIEWARAWAENYQKFRRGSGDPSFVASGAWPVRR
ncbi:exonuclease domain-containing protein [Pontimonas sp.]|jgi:DNA polymerase-3 subunit epsilon|nr:exonuclease domain-containing protein [Pontimonas sp.]MDA8862643.1 exonuclease domain-containing protein [Pontimonas sp.]MDP4634615.1 exonuclease domain-containing protein [Pontimonas sp.]MDP4816413.1 exonuclease domain-containing protein [Pontimonas sp.]